MEGRKDGWMDENILGPPDGQVQETLPSLIPIQETREIFQGLMVPAVPSEGCGRPSECGP